MSLDSINEDFIKQNGPECFNALTNWYLKSENKEKTHSSIEDVWSAAWKSALATIPNPSAVKEVVEAAKDALRALKKMACFNTGGDGVICYGCEMEMEEGKAEIEHDQFCLLQKAIITFELALESLNKKEEA